MPNDNILFLYGNDEFAIARRLADLQSRHDKDGMNTARLEARTVSEDELNNAVNAMPFLTDRRLVFLSNPSARTSAPAARQKFLDFLLAGPPSTLVVMHELIEPREAAKHWLVRRVEKGDFKAETFFMPRLKDIPGWIVNEAKRQKGQIEPAAAARLAEMVGEDTRIAAQEITKLLTYVDFARPVTVADVESVSIVSAQGDVFALVDALASGDGKRSQRVLRQLLEDEDAFALWGMVIRQFRLLLQAREILDGRGNRIDIQKTLRVHEFVAGKISDQSAHFSMSALEKIYHRLLEMDEAAKTGEMPLDVALEMFVVELTRK
jgi:DNA polymerase-3 subunit delta